MNSEQLLTKLEAVWPTPNFEEWRTTADMFEYHNREVSALLPAIAQLISTATAEAEQRMGEAIKARYRQANGQWEKVESFIDSYEVQKRDDPHGIFAKSASVTPEKTEQYLCQSYAEDGKIINCTCGKCALR